MRIDIDPNFSPHPMSKDLVTKSGDSAVESSIKNLVLTNYYERGFNVEVGQNVKDQLFENFNALTQETIKNSIRRVIQNFEKTVEVIDILSELTDPNGITITILYNINNNPVTKSTSIQLKRLR